MALPSPSGIWILLDEREDRINNDHDPIRWWIYQPVTTMAPEAFPSQMAMPSSIHGSLPEQPGCRLASGKNHWVD